MRERLLWCIVSLVLLAAGARAAEGPPVTPWRPSESYPGGTQYDARLDRPVRFWQAGRPLATVFAEVERQTGVTVGFFPPDDDNARICVNVYLDPQQPPALRSLLAQLAWATDCTFATAGEGDGRSYTLLSTDIGRNVLPKLRALEREASQQQDEAWQASWQEDRRRALAKVGELREALKLSREQAAERYRGKEDGLLFTLLDPECRAAAEFVLSLSAADLETVAEHECERAWSELSPEQRDLLRQMYALHPAQSALMPGETPHPDASELTDAASLRVSIGYVQNGLSVVVLPPQSPPATEGQAVPQPWYPVGTHLFLMNDLREEVREEQAVFFALQVRALLGETTKEEVERQAFDWQMARGERREQRELLTRLDEQRPDLRAEMRDLLAATPLALDPKRLYTLWQVQAAAAAATGMNVVSDCFWQPPRDLEALRKHLWPEAALPATALEVLRLSCFARTERKDMLQNARPQDSPLVSGEEWGGAGSFLHFRSRDRDLMRAGFLPRAAVDAMNAWLDPGLQELPQAGVLPKVEAPIDPRRYLRLFEGLTALQRRWGGLVLYEDPTEPRNAYREPFRAKVLEIGARPTSCGYRLGLLGDDLWNRLCGEGIRWGVDFTSPEDKEQGEVFGRYGANPGKGNLLRLKDFLPGFSTTLRAGGASAARLLEVEPWEQGRPLIVLPTVLIVTPNAFDLTAAPEK